MSSRDVRSRDRSAREFRMVVPHDHLTNTYRGGMTPHASTDAFGRPSRAVPSGWESLDDSLRTDERGAPKGEEEVRANVEAALAALLERRTPPPERSRPVPDSGEAETRHHTPRGFARGAVHEWFGTVSSKGVSGKNEPSAASRASNWSPPLFLFVHLAQRAVQDARRRGAPAHVVWIGRRVWPYPCALEGSAELLEPERVDRCESRVALEFSLELREATFPFGSYGSSPPEPPSGPNATLLEHSIFVDPGRTENGEGETLWAIDTALRSPGVTAIVADGTGLGMAATRRLQLVAADSSALVLLARPPDEAGEVSAATTRWLVEREAGWERRPRWRVRLLRAKGAQTLARD